MVFLLHRMLNSGIVLFIREVTFLCRRVKRILRVQRDQYRSFHPSHQVLNRHYQLPSFCRSPFEVPERRRVLQTNTPNNAITRQEQYQHNLRPKRAWTSQPATDRPRAQDALPHIVLESSSAQRGEGSPYLVQPQLFESGTLQRNGLGRPSTRQGTTCS